MTDWSTATAEQIISDIRAVKQRVVDDDKSIQATHFTVNHIVHKVRMGELKQSIAEKMLLALEQGMEPDYRTLYVAAVRTPLATKVYHSAPSEFRAQIEAEGLRMALPSDGQYNINAAGQPRAVYVSPEPDRVGLWALTDEWDIWEIDTDGFTWQHDQMNVGCWAILHDIPAHKIHLFETCTQKWNS